MATPLNLLQLVQRTQAELGLPQSSSVVGNSDNTTQQLLALANRVVDELRRCKDDGWTALQFEYDLVVPAAIVTQGDQPIVNGVYITNIPSTAGILANYFVVTGPSVPNGARVAAVLDANTIQMTMEATNQEATTGDTFVFAQDTFPEPAGFDYFVNRTMWDRTNRWELIGPDSPQVDEWHRSGIVSLGPRRHFRQVGPGITGVGNNFRIWPPPTELVEPIQLVFEYSSLYSIVVQGNISTPTYAEYFANDTDFSLLDDQALIMGMKWMFWEIKGMGSYVTLQSRWVDYVERLKARDGAAPTLQLAKRISPIFISPANVQDGFFPGPAGQSGI
jgi:hypothetical protein